MYAGIQEIPSPLLSGSNQDEKRLFSIVVQPNRSCVSVNINEEVVTIGLWLSLPKTEIERENGSLLYHLTPQNEHFSLYTLFWDLLYIFAIDSSLIVPLNTSEWHTPLVSPLALPSLDHPTQPLNVPGCRVRDLHKPSQPGPELEVWITCKQYKLGQHSERNNEINVEITSCCGSKTERWYENCRKNVGEHSLSDCSTRAVLQWSEM